MTLVKCAECGNDVSTQAKACPKCGAKVPKPKKRRSPVWIALAVAVGGVVIFTMAQEELRKDEAAAAQVAKSPEQRAREAADKEKRTAQLRAAGAALMTLKAAMKDPEAFELQSAVVKPNGTACFEYRAKNSFGAILPNSAVYTTAGKLLVHERDGNAFVGAWNRDCTPAGGDEVADLMKRLGIV